MHHHTHLYLLQFSFKPSTGKRVEVNTQKTIGIPSLATEDRRSITENVLTSK